MRFLPVNLDALLIELDTLNETSALLHSLRRSPVDGVDELVPAARTVLVRFRPDVCVAGKLIREITRRELRAPNQHSGSLIEIPVRYDGEDLNEVAAMVGISAANVVRRHAGGEYMVAFNGFSPGFAYLAGGDPLLNLPRRSSPRTQIKAGAVGLAGEFSGVYPQASPGGWRIIGTTPFEMWNIGRPLPALLRPGDRVRFVDMQSISASELDRIEAAYASFVGSSAVTRSTTYGTDCQCALEVISPGLQTLFQDLGRQGCAAQGVSVSGAMDRGALRAANRLVGNPADSACLETAYGGLSLRSRGDTVLAVTGADAALALVDRNGRRALMPRYRPIALSEGDTLTVADPRAGSRAYIAVRGGFAMQSVMGSCATDTLAEIGPEPLTAGDRLWVRPINQGMVVELDDLPSDDLPSPNRIVTLDVVLGPRTDWFTSDAIELLRNQSWRVTPRSNRVGIRLTGEKPLQRRYSGELPSEGAIFGSIQVPPNGQPVVFLADHPLTGGYPVIGAVAPYHLGRLGQIPINALIRFHPIRDFAELSCAENSTLPMTK